MKDDVIRSEATVTVVFTVLVCLACSSCWFLAVVVNGCGLMQVLDEGISEYSESCWHKCCFFDSEFSELFQYSLY